MLNAPNPYLLYKSRIENVANKKIIVNSPIAMLVRLQSFRKKYVQGLEGLNARLIVPSVINGPSVLYEPDEINSMAPFILLISWYSLSTFQTG